MFAKFVCRRWFVPALLLGQWTTMSAGAGSDKGSPVKYDLSNYRPQIVRRQSGEIKAFGKNLNLQSVEIAPPEGISVQQIQEIAADPEDKRQTEKGVRVWSIHLGTDGSAALGDHSLVLITPAGRSDPRTFQLTTHLPLISGLKVLSASSDGVVEIELSVFDEAGDITPEKSPSPNYTLRCGSHVILVIGGSPNRVVMKNPHNAILYDRQTFSQPGQAMTIKGICMLKFSLRDKEDNGSNELNTAVEFKP
jgi:hypothetical protein